MKKVKVLKDVCIGCGACQAICSSVYEIDDGEKLDRDWLRQANDIYTHYAP